MKIAVIGCGWLGLPLAKEFISKGHIIYGSTTSINKFEELKTVGIKPFFYTGQLNQLDSIAVNEIDCLIINFPPSKSANYPTQTAELIDQFSENCKIIFTSSTSVYEDFEGVVTETGNIKNDHLVFQAEEKIKYSGRPYTILRLSGLIGENRHPVNFLSGKIIENGNMVVNLVHQLDVIAAIILVIEKNIWHKTYNVCWNQHPKKSDYYTNFAMENDIIPPVFRASKLNGKSINGNLITHDLGFQYKHTI